MYVVRANVGIQQYKRGSVFQLTPEQYDKIKGFVTVISAPEPEVSVEVEAEPEVEVEEEVTEDDVLWSEPSEDVDADEPDSAWDFDDADEPEED